jgi:hypothetical protein
MLAFDPQDPYPLLLSPEDATYAEAQLHAAEVDRWLGLETERIECELVTRGRATPDQQLWIGLPVQAMLTPYTELRSMLARLAPLPGQTIVDLGAGYGRMGLVIARHHPGVRFVGYEYVAERVNAGGLAIAEQLAMSSSRAELRAEMYIELTQSDLAAPGFAPIPADTYFIYDYGTRAAIEKTLQDLRALARTRALTVIGRGRASRDAIERDHPWLSQVREPEHLGHYSIYRTHI